MGVSSSLLETEFEAELQATHLRAGSQVRDASAAAAIHASIRVVEVDMVENVEGLELELRLGLLANVDGLEHT